MRHHSLNLRFWKTRLSSALAPLVLVTLLALPANSCPFCSAVARTFTEQMDSSDVVVIATLESEPEGESKADLPRATFQVCNLFKGKDILSAGHEFKAVIVSRDIEIGEKFLVMGNGTDSINWTTPQKVSDTVIEYLAQLDALPESGPERLAFFKNYFEHEESMLAYDAYDEFARASYADVKGLKDQLKVDRLIGFLTDPDVMKSRKRLYYTLLGVSDAGDKELAFLEEIIKSGDRDRQAGLDALIACYLTLKGDAGVPLVEETFLKNPDAEYIDIFSAISALRFHGTESDVVSKGRIVEALRYVLDRPKMADMVIPDLARWEDWTVMERLVQMFKDCDTDETRWVRTPIISYLRECPLEEATGHLAELREIDPTAAQRADMLAELDWGDEDDDWGDDDDSGDDLPEQPRPDSDEGTSGDKDDGKAKDKKDKQGDQQSNGKKEDGQAGQDDVGDVVANGANAASEVVLNHSPESFVSTGDPVTGDRATVGREANPIPVSGQPNEQLAQRVNPEPPAAMIVPEFPSILIMVLGVLVISAILFLLLWSVLNGSFERLIS